MPNPIIEQSLNQYDINYGSGANGLADSIFGQWLMPGLQQTKEFAQQIALTEYQQEWNSEGAKLKREIEAGVNPYLAAAGIAGAGGSSSPAASAPNSAVGSGAQGVSSAAGLANSVIEGIDRLSTLNERTDKLNAETQHELEAAGFDKWQAKAIVELLPGRKKNLRADTWLKLGQFKNTAAEYRNIRKEYDVKKQTIETMKKQAYNYEMQGDYANALKFRTDVETAILDIEKWWRETDKQFWLDHGYRMDDDMDIALRNAAANGHDVDVDQVSSTIERFSYETQSGIEQAQVENAFAKAFDEAKGRADVAALFAEFNADIDAWKQIFIDMYRSAFENPKDIQGAISKAFNQFCNLLNSISVTAHQQGSPYGNRVGSHDKPPQGSKYGKNR